MIADHPICGSASGPSSELGSPTRRRHFAQNLVTSFKKEGNQIMDMETTHLAERVRLNWFDGYAYILTYVSKSDF